MSFIEKTMILFFQALFLINPDFPAHSLAVKSCFECQKQIFLFCFLLYSAKMSPLLTACFRPTRERAQAQNELGGWDGEAIAIFQTITIVILHISN